MEIKDNKGYSFHINNLNNKFAANIIEALNNGG